jgi:hypothetical protein
MENRAEFQLHVEELEERIAPSSADFLSGNLAAGSDDANELPAPAGNPSTEIR